MGGSDEKIQERFRGYSFQIRKKTSYICEDSFEALNVRISFDIGAVVARFYAAKPSILMGSRHHPFVERVVLFIGFVTIVLTQKKLPKNHQNQ